MNIRHYFGTVLVCGWAALLSGCVSGPFRSTVVGHKESATVNWTKASPVVVKPFAAVGGAVTDVALVPLDTAAKTVINVVVRPLTCLYEKGGCLGPSTLTYPMVCGDETFQTPGDVIFDVLLFPITLPFCGLTHDAWDDCFGNASDRRIASCIERGEYSKARELAEKSCGIPMDICESDYGWSYGKSVKFSFLVAGDAGLERWRNEWLKKTDESLEAAVKNAENGLNEEVEPLIALHLYDRAVAVCEQWDTGGVPEIVPWLDAFRQERIQDIRRRHAEHVMVKLEEVISLCPGDYGAALAACQEFDVKQVVGHERELETARRREFEKICSEKTDDVARGMTAAVDAALALGKFEDAARDCVDDVDAAEIFESFSCPGVYGAEETVADAVSAVRRHQTAERKRIEETWAEKLVSEFQGNVGDLIRAKNFGDADDAVDAFSLPEALDSCRAMQVAAQATARKDIAAAREREAKLKAEKEAEAKAKAERKAAEERARKEAEAAAERWRQEQNRILPELLEQLESQMVSLPWQEYKVCKYEVTQALWYAVMGTRPSKFKGDDRPVECVSWNDCQEFIQKLNARPEVKKSGLTYRLPTEEEWRYACRAGAWEYADYGMVADDYGLLESHSSGSLDEMGWYKGNSGGQTHPVGRKRPNAFGLYDMHGNVSEWTSSPGWVYIMFAFCGATEGWQRDDDKRMTCGGSYCHDADACRTNGKKGDFDDAHPDDGDPPKKRYCNVGLRLFAN